MARINILEKGAQLINAIMERLNNAKTKTEVYEASQDLMRHKAFKIEPFLNKLHMIEKAEAGVAQSIQRTQQPQRPMGQSYSNQYQPQTQYQPQPQVAYAGGYAPIPQQPNRQDTEKSLKNLMDMARQRRVN